MFGKRSDQPRTADDRARAAANRAARRAGKPLPPEAFEYTVRPPDVEPHDPLRQEEPEPVAWEEPPTEAAPPRAEPEETAPPRADAAARRADAVGFDDEAADDNTSRAGAAPSRATAADFDDHAAGNDTSHDVAASDDDDDARPVAGDADTSRAAAAPRAAAADAGTLRADTVAPGPTAGDVDASPRAEPTAAGSDDEAAAVDTSRADAAPPRVEAARVDAEAAAPPVTDAIADDTPEPATESHAAGHEADATAANGAAIDDAARAAAAAEARALRENAGSANPRDEAPREEIVHQPTVEYTPFQTEEHEVPLGEPRDDEPRLVAARGFPGDRDEVHAFATSRPDTAEHDAAFETGEHHPPEETEVRPPVPLRKAPERPAEPARRRAAPNAPKGRSRPPKTPKGPRPKGAAHWGRRIFTLVAVLVFAAVLYAFNQTFQPFHSDGSGSAIVNIPQNTDAGDIAKLLEQQGVVDSARFFELRATLGGERGNLRPGHYVLKKDMTNGAVITALTKVPENPKAAPTVSATIIEGPSIKENAPVVDKSKKVEGSYAKAADSPAVLERIRELGAPKGTKTAEGFLFPATYTLKVGAPASQLVNEQLDAFEENFKKVDMKYAKSKKLTRYDVLIIASMIEREAQLARERPLVSAVIYNRLKQGMPLAIDATTRYSTNNWQKPILQSQLDKQEPYNTRLNRGLPPTPIGNPGLASIKAAAKPSSKKYLFYVRKPGKSGAHAFSSTDAQFAKDLEKYNDARKGK